MRAAKQRARDLVDSESPAMAAFESATELMDFDRDELELDGSLRARTAKRVADEEGLSLVGLADRIGVSKARAQQLKNAGKRADTTPESQDEEAQQ